LPRIAPPPRNVRHRLSVPSQLPPRPSGRGHRDRPAGSVHGEAMIRYLRPGDPIPEGEPRRYSTPKGYVRLRWKVGPYEYVEAWEHRVLVGNPDGHQVHHVNHQPRVARRIRPVCRDIGCLRDHRLSISDTTARRTA